MLSSPAIPTHLLGLNPFLSFPSPVLPPPCLSVTCSKNTFLLLDEEAQSWYVPPSVISSAEKSSVTDVDANRWPLCQHYSSPGHHKVLYVQEWHCQGIGLASWMGQPWSEISINLQVTAENNLNGLQEFPTITLYFKKISKNSQRIV